MAAARARGVRERSEGMSGRQGPTVNVKVLKSWGGGGQRVILESELFQRKWRHQGG